MPLTRRPQVNRSIADKVHNDKGRVKWFTVPLAEYQLIQTVVYSQVTLPYSGDGVGGSLSIKIEIGLIGSHCLHISFTSFGV